MFYVIDRIENGIAVCECLKTGEKLEIETLSLPKGVKEGDIIRDDSNGFIVDSDATARRKAELSDRLNRLFGRNR